MKKTTIIELISRDSRPKKSWLEFGRVHCLLLVVLSLFLAVMSSPKLAAAQTRQKLGIHIMNPGETDEATLLFNSSIDDQSWRYVTVPITLDDLKKEAVWTEFFLKAKEKKIVPIVRLATRPDGSVWQRPSKKDVADLFMFLSQFEWPTQERYVIIFNEVNHAKEWGGSIDPSGYAEILDFAKKWSDSEGLNYKILPAAMDLATPDTAQSREAFRYLGEMVRSHPRIFDSVDLWNSHSYPNPGFVSSPERKGKNSLRGFQVELDFIKKLTGRELQVMITETGWRETSYTASKLEQYYVYAQKNIWSDSRVLGVTPFILRGDPGPFSQFSFLTSDNLQTKQYQAFQKADLLSKKVE